LSKTTLKTKPKPKLNLALQGGGAHGTFTWGVLDRLLEADRFEIDTISATSAGAVNAVAMVSGLVKGGPEGGRTLLRELWGAVVKAASPDMSRLNPMLAGLDANSMAQMASMMSPYAFNPFDINPLRRMLSEMIDFEAIVQDGAVELLIAATDASTGQARLFRRKELTVDVVMASACLPMLYKAVKIGDNHYWDGGFAANPDLVTLPRVAKAKDTLVVLLNPTSRAAVPTQAADILGQINQITFNQPLLRDVRDPRGVGRAAGHAGGGPAQAGGDAPVPSDRGRALYCDAARDQQDAAGPGDLGQAV
jgi:NTE family protein